MDNLLKENGTSFTAIIDGKKCEGKVRVEDNRVYLCQDKSRGDACKNKLGYKFSWIVDDGTSFTLTNNRVKDFKLVDIKWKEGDTLNSPSLQNYTIGFINDKVMIVVNNLTDTVITLSLTNVKNLGWTLYVPPVKKAPVKKVKPIVTLQELTIDEIGKKFKIDPKLIRIKKASK